MRLHPSVNLGNCHLTARGQSEELRSLSCSHFSGERRAARAASFSEEHFPAPGGERGDPVSSCSRNRARSPSLELLFSKLNPTFAFKLIGLPGFPKSR